MNDLISTDTGLSVKQRDTLQRLFGYMIPADADHAVPGADDAEIFADILLSARDSVSALGGFMDDLNALAQEQGQCDFCALPTSALTEVVDAFRGALGARAALLESLAAQCYYRDPRVMQSLGMEPRAPFPKGFVIEEGDWSLLEPVKMRAPFYRPV